MDNNGTFLSPRGRSPQKLGPTAGSGLGAIVVAQQSSPPPTAPAAPLIEEETRSSFTDQPPSKPPSPVGEPPLEETGTPSQSMDGTEDSKSGKTAKKKLRCSDLQIAEQALGSYKYLVALGKSVRFAATYFHYIKTARTTNSEEQVANHIVICQILHDTRNQTLN